jgi:hypothetical protein
MTISVNKIKINNLLIIINDNLIILKFFGQGHGQRQGQGFFSCIKISNLLDSCRELLYLDVSLRA